MKINSLMTVCVGNVCRSPVAEAFLKKQCQNLTIASAGFAAPDGRGASPKMINRAAKDGIDLAPHRARILDQSKPHNFDLILVMEKSHLNEMGRRHPHLRARTMLLTHWNGGQDILDPINEGDEFNAKIYDQIIEASSVWAKKLGMKNG